MQQYFTDPKTGKFDANTAKQQFAALKSRANDPQVQNFNEAYIDPLFLQTLGEKYQALNKRRRVCSEMDERKNEC